MRKKLPGIIALLIWCAFAYSQPCLPEGITFSSQAQIDSFQINYPGCTEIEGSVTIDGDDITNLNGLNDLTIINEALVIGGPSSLINLHNPNLKTLSGLENLTKCGELRIMGNDSLVSITGLNNLIFVDNNLLIGHYNMGPNPYLKQLSGLSNLANIGGDLNIDRNFILENLSGLENLSEIGGSLILGTGYWTFSPFGNPLLEDILALSNLSSIGDILYIEDNPSLKHLTGLEGLNSIGSELYICDNSSLLDLLGLNNLISVNANGTEWGGITIEVNGSMSSLEGLNNLEAINGKLAINSNNNLSDISSLENVVSIAGDLTIVNNDLLSICHIQSICDYLLSPSGNVFIQNNAPGCNSLQEVEDACEGVSIGELQLPEIFSISPNPSSEIIHIKISTTECQVIIFDMIDFTGKMVKSIIFEMNEPGIQELEIDLSDIPAGIYFGRIRTNNGIQTQKIIKL